MDKLLKHRRSIVAKVVKDLPLFIAPIDLEEGDVIFISSAVVGWILTEIERQGKVVWKEVGR